MDHTISAELVEWRPTHLAYMASPPIFVGAAGVYSDSLAARFRAIYVDRFGDLVHDLDPDELSGVLWPSSEAVEHPAPGMAEYADAKRVGEQACRRLAAEHPRLAGGGAALFAPAHRSDHVVRAGRVRRRRRRAARGSSVCDPAGRALTVHSSPCQTC